MKERIKESPATTKTIETCLDMIEFMVSSNQELGIRELARNLSLSKSTVYRYMQTLEKRKIVELNPENNKYKIGTRLYFLASMTLDKVDLRSIALPYMKEVVHLTNETVYLYLRDNDYLTYVEKVECTHGIKHIVEIGKAYYLPQAASGKAILAFLSPGEVDLILSRPIPPATPDTVTDPEVLKKSLEEVRRQGYAFSLGERVAGAAAIASPIFNKEKRVIGGINITIPKNRFDIVRLGEFARLAKGCARQISLKMGYIFNEDE